MNIFASAACAVCAAVFAALIKKSNKEYALLTVLAACVVIILSLTEDIREFLTSINRLSEETDIYEAVISPVLKAVGIALAGQLASQICKDAGESALSSTVDLAAKVSIMTVSLPLISKLFLLLEEILNL